MFTPSSGIPTKKLAIVAKALGQNVGAIDDHCRALGVTEADIDADPTQVAQKVNYRMGELEAMMGAGW